MSNQARIDRLREDVRVLEALRDESSVFDFVQEEGDDPDQFTLIFRGKGIRRDRNSETGYTEVNEHKCEIKMGYGYPERPPELRWLTPTYHPNITYSGVISLKALGLPWDKSVSVDVICERLWDAGRMAYFDLENASNYNAKNWLETEAKLDFPLDSRPLRDGASEDTHAGSNIVRYRRKEPGEVAAEPKKKNAEPERRIAFDSKAPAAEVFFIDEDKRPAISFESPVRVRGQAQPDDDITFFDWANGPARLARPVPSRIPPKNE